MSTSTYGMTDLMEMLSAGAGLPRSAWTDDENATFEQVGLDSLALLQVQGELSRRLGVEIDENTTYHTFGDIVAAVNAALAQKAESAA